MLQFITLNFLVFVVPFVASSDKGLKCYTCLGRDYENCKRGSVTCEGACFKLVDEGHLLFAKGCDPSVHAASTKEDVELKDVQLPWDNKTPIKGTAYYCKTEFCNASAPMRSGLLFGLGSVIAALIIRPLFFV